MNALNEADVTLEEADRLCRTVNGTRRVKGTILSWIQCAVCNSIFFSTNSDKGMREKGVHRHLCQICRVQDKRYKENAKRRKHPKPKG